MIATLRRHPMLTLAFALCLLAVLAFGTAAVLHGLRWRDRPEPPIAGWMTVGVIAHARDLDPRDIDALAGLPTPEEAGRPLTLREIARDRDRPLPEIIAAVEAAIATLRQAP